MKLLFFVLVFLILMGSASAGSATEITYGEESKFSTSATSDLYVAALNSTHVVVAYKEGNNLTSKIGIVTGNTITSYGSESIIAQGLGIDDISIAVLNSTHFIVAYNNDSETQNYYDGYAKVGVVSSTTITYGAEYKFDSVDESFESIRGISITSLDSAHFVVAYIDGNNSNAGTAIAGSVSDTTITYGAESIFNSTQANYISIATLDSTHFVIGYAVGFSGNGIVGSVSDNTITFGDENRFSTLQMSSMRTTGLDSTHFVIGYCEPGEASAIVGSVSGTTISFGTPNVFTSSYASTIGIGSFNSTHFVMAYNDEVGINTGNSIVGIVSGTTITSYGSEYPIIAPDSETRYHTIGMMNESHFVVAFWYGSELYLQSGTIPVIVPDYIPPVPVSLSNIIDYPTYAVNWTWSPGSGTVTDSYNVSYNGTWTNGSSNTYYNHVLGGYGTSDIVIWAYNSSGDGNLSLTSLSGSQDILSIHITSYTPSTPHTSYVSNDQEFEITMSETGNATWYLDGNEVFNESGVSSSSYTFTDPSAGTYNVTVCIENDGDSDCQTWVWTVGSPILFSVYLLILIFAVISTGYSILFKDTINFTHIISGFLAAILWFILGYQAYAGIGFEHIINNAVYSGGVVQSIEETVVIESYQYGWLGMVFVIGGVVMALYTIILGYIANKDIIEELEDKDEMEKESLHDPVR